VQEEEHNARLFGTRLMRALGAQKNVTSALLFDLGNTLVSYYRREQFRPILERAIANVLEELESRNIVVPALEIVMERALMQNREAKDYRVNPLLNRLQSICDLSPPNALSLGNLLCARFLEPIFGVSQTYDDAVPALKAVRGAGYRTAIVSNTPWGSPPELWRTELERLGLSSLVDRVILCGDVGWRKPAPQIFEHTAESLGVSCDECVFVGDELQWDVAGSAAVGMRSLLIDRSNVHSDYEGDRIVSLEGLVDYLNSGAPVERLAFGCSGRDRKGHALCKREEHNVRPFRLAAQRGVGRKKK
jgi:putative hydrolase of the HAD superfamily